MFCFQKKKKGTWSSLVYGTRFEHEHFKESRRFESGSARKI